MFLLSVSVLWHSPSQGRWHVIWLHTSLHGCMWRERERRKKRILVFISVLKLNSLSVPVCLSLSLSLSLSLCLSLLHQHHSTFYTAFYSDRQSQSHLLTVTVSTWKTPVPWSQFHWPFRSECCGGSFFLYLHIYLRSVIYCLPVFKI